MKSINKTILAIAMLSMGTVSAEVYNAAETTRDNDGNWFSYTWVNQNDNGVYTYDELDAFNATQDSTLWSDLASKSNDISADALLVTDELDAAIKIIDASKDSSVIKSESTAVLDDSGQIIAFVNEDGNVVINADQIAIANDNAEMSHEANEEAREVNGGVSAESVSNVKDFLFDLAAKQGKEDFVQSLLDGGSKILDVLITDQMVSDVLSLDIKEGTSEEVFSMFVSDSDAGTTDLGKNAVRIDVNSIITQDGFVDNLGNTAKFSAAVAKYSTVDTIDDCKDNGATDRKKANAGKCVASVVNSIVNTIAIASAPVTLGMSLAIIPTANIAVSTITDVATSGSSVTEGATLDYLSDNGFVEGWSSDTLATDWYLKNRTNGWDGARVKFAELGYYTNKTATSNGTDYVIVVTMNEWAALGISDRFAEAERHFRAYSQVPENGVLMYAMSDLSDLVINNLAEAGDEKAIAHKAYRELRQSEFNTHLQNFDIVESNEATRALNYGENSQAAKSLADQYRNGTVQQKLARPEHITDAVLEAWSQGWNGTGTTAVTVGSSIEFADIAFGAEHSTADTLIDAVALGGDVLLNIGNDAKLDIEYLNPETVIVDRVRTEQVEVILGSRSLIKDTFTGYSNSIDRLQSTAGSTCPGYYAMTRNGQNIGLQKAINDNAALASEWETQNDLDWRLTWLFHYDAKAAAQAKKVEIENKIKSTVYKFTCNDGATQSQLDAGLFENIVRIDDVEVSYQEIINNEDGIFQIVANDTVLVTSIDNNNADLGVRILNEYGDDRIANQMLVVGDLDDTADIVMDQYVVDTSAGATAATVSLVRGKFKNLTAERAVEIIKATATDIGFEGVDAQYGNGKVNMLKALSPYNTLTGL